MTISALLAWLVTGLVVGGLAHLLVPGRQRIGILLTLLFGIVGALAGGIITAALIGAGHLIVTFIVSVIGPAVLTAVVSPPSSHRYVRSSRRRRSTYSRRRRHHALW